MVAVPDSRNIEPASLGDLEAIHHIEQAAFVNPWNWEMLRAAVLNPDYDVRVLRSPAAQVQGFYIAHRVLHRCNLDNLAVAEAVRRGGLGSRLLQDWIMRAAEQRLSTLTLQVNTANAGAQRLYRFHRFKPSRLLVRYYPNGDDAYEMERDISGLSRRESLLEREGR